ncbi:hypothetical protein PHYBLDRAFT_175956 [Phycomyces blakesleeanus NRRL 1555(-)]|uniref:Uncharacterized protein n=1 Tax=Phycomyces blakesleeanus (strain ATCC 8743b / DSM 1359 / FGSC 10004 / NBRC 33097 / NRRL 1555) TaxID=763407 RepID=A0A167J9W2_PHYB8|nr:hypothetical protein PHYBLDRAFT_175956 [Phycomyces blakesleeanus NRRL 1555(-)]OAD65568.1 hypothetical protein PHYBLDRAFT_175956 [Phycomyces blakesleeanus NRRL 1555(-)]|eukprot:XP_018283608.1 hypothetical protein PHYBLDRAFT_175956 [Phycomyces blakesleeanus NRRL 1555(-)]
MAIWISQGCIAKKYSIQLNMTIKMMNNPLSNMLYIINYHLMLPLLTCPNKNASAAITQHTLKKIIKMLSNSKLFAFEKNYDIYKYFASIWKLKLQQKKLMIRKAQDKISKGCYFFKGQNKTKKLVTQKERLDFLLALDERGFLEEF